MIRQYLLVGSSTGSLLWAVARMAPPDAPGGGSPGPKRDPMGSPSLKMPVETQLGNEFGGTVEHGEYSSESNQDGAGLTAEIGTDGATVRKDDDNTETQVDRPEGQTEGDFTLPEGDFNPQDPASVQAFEQAFTAEGGNGYNFAALSQDFYRNNGEGLSEGTYKWLESRGIDRATAKSIEEGQKALASSGANAVFVRAGGEANYRGAIEWAKGGGYTPEQRKAFNAALDQGGEVANMAVDALMSRATKAGFRPQRRQQPQRTTAAAGGGAAPAAPAVQPFANYTEYQQALRKAKETNDQRLFDEVRKRGKASKFY